MPDTLKHLKLLHCRKQELPLFKLSKWLSFKAAEYLLIAVITWLDGNLWRKATNTSFTSTDTNYKVRQCEMGYF